MACVMTTGIAMLSVDLFWKLVGLKHADGVKCFGREISI